MTVQNPQVSIQIGDLDIFLEDQEYKHEFSYQSGWVAVCVLACIVLLGIFTIIWYYAEST